MLKVITELEKLGLELTDEMKESIKKNIGEEVYSKSELDKKVKKVEEERDQYKGRAETAEETLKGCFKCSPTTNKAVIVKRRSLEGLAEWLESMKYPPLSEGRTIRKIERTTTTILSGKDESGASVFQCGFNLLYFKKG